jgi:hypothetical protein
LFLLFNNYRTSKSLILSMKHLSMKFKQATLLLLGTIILPFAIHAQADDDEEGDGGGAGGVSAAPASMATISVDAASQADERITLIRSGYSFDFAASLSFSDAPDYAKLLMSEAAVLLNDIFQDVTITGGAVDSDRIFDRARMDAGGFAVKMIELGASYSGNQTIASAITSAIDTGSLSSEDGYVGKLSAVLSNSSNYGLLGARNKGVGNLFNLTTDDVEAFAGKNVTINTTSEVDLSSQSTKVFAIAGGNDLTISSDVTFSKRSSTWNKETLAIGAADDLTITKGTTVEYKGNYLGLGANDSVILEEVTLKAKHGIGVASLDDVDITNGSFNISGKGGFGIYAQDEINVNGLIFAGAGTAEYIYMEARTVNLSNIDFPAGSKVDLLSELGPINSKYPHFGGISPGRVNFIEAVSYGGAANAMTDAATFDEFGANIQIRKN